MKNERPGTPCESCGRPIRDHALVEYVFCGEDPTPEARARVETASMHLAMFTADELRAELNT